MKSESAPPADFLSLLDNAPISHEGLVRRDPSLLREFIEVPKTMDQIHITARDVFTHAVLAKKGFGRGWLHTFYESFCDFGRNLHGSSNNGYSNPESDYWIKMMQNPRYTMKEAGLLFQDSTKSIVSLSIGVPNIPNGQWEDLISATKWSDSFYVTPNGTTSDAFVDHRSDHDIWVANLRVFNSTNNAVSQVHGEDIVGFSGKMLSQFERRLKRNTRKEMYHSQSPLVYCIGSDAVNLDAKLFISYFNVLGTHDLDENIQTNPPNPVEIHDTYAEIHVWNGKHRIAIVLGSTWLSIEDIYVMPSSNIPKRIRYELSLNRENSIDSSKILAPLDPYQIDHFQRDPWARFVTPFSSTNITHKFQLNPTDMTRIQVMIDNHVAPLMDEYPGIVNFLNSGSWLINQYSAQIL